MSDCTCMRTCKNDSERICQLDRNRSVAPRTTDVDLTYVTDTNGDWAALYINGADTGPSQNHSLDTADLLRLLVGTTVLSVKHMEVDSKDGEAEWMSGRGFPHYLSDIPKEARST